MSNKKQIRNKQRLCIYLLKLSVRGEIVRTNLRKLLRDLYNETGEIFAQTGYGIVFESIIKVDSDSVCNPLDKEVGCGTGYNIKDGICSSDLHKPMVPIVISSLADQYENDLNPFPGNLFTVSSVLPTIKPLPTIKKCQIIKFRRDFGDASTTKYWPKNINYERYQIKKVENDTNNYGFVDIIK